MPHISALFVSILIVLYAYITNGEKLTGSSHYLCDSGRLGQDCTGDTIICAPNADCIIDATYNTQPPTNTPTPSPTTNPTPSPTSTPTSKPTNKPTYKPTYKPTRKPTNCRRRLGEETRRRLDCDDDRRRLLSNPACSSNNNAGACDTTIECPVGYKCIIHCEFACDGMTVLAADSSYLRIYGCNKKNGYDTCANMNIYCPISTNKLLGGNSCIIEAEGAIYNGYELDTVSIYTEDAFNDLSISLLNVVSSTIHCGDQIPPQYLCQLNSAGNGCAIKSKCDRYPLTTIEPTMDPTKNPTKDPTLEPTDKPSMTPTEITMNPSMKPTYRPTGIPTEAENEVDEETDNNIDGETDDSDQDTSLTNEDRTENDGDSGILNKIQDIIGLSWKLIIGISVCIFLCCFLVFCWVCFMRRSKKYKRQKDEQFAKPLLDTDDNNNNRNSKVEMDILDAINPKYSVTSDNSDDLQYQLSRPPISTAGGDIGINYNKDTMIGSDDMEFEGNYNRLNSSKLMGSFTTTATTRNTYNDDMIIEQGNIGDDEFIINDSMDKTPSSANLVGVIKKFRSVVPTANINGDDDDDTDDIDEIDDINNDVDDIDIDDIDGFDVKTAGFVNDEYNENKHIDNDNDIDDEVDTSGFIDHHSDDSQIENTMQ